MGIRFYCPNGHRLHVKTFQAGKRGICPHCDARFRIPRESEIPRGAPRVRSHGEAVAAAAPVMFVAEQTDALPASENAPAADGPASRRSPEALLAESPENVWYVRPPSGGQYGPARGDVLRRWLDEGRVSADTLVWRDGWPEWRLAGPLFSQLPTEAAPQESEIATEPEPEPTAVADARSRHDGAARPPGLAPSRKSLAVIAAVAVLSLALLAAIFFAVRAA